MNTTIDLTPIFQALIGLLATIITCKVIPWIKAKTSNEQQQMLQVTVRTLVYAAEQIYGAGKGEEKLGYVVRNLQTRGFTVDIAEIEAAVKEASSWLRDTNTNTDATDTTE